MKKKFAISCFLVTVFCSSLSFSVLQPWSEVSEFVASTTKRMNYYISKERISNGQQDWKLASVWLRVQSQFGIQIPWLAALRIVPEVEVVIEED